VDVALVGVRETRLCEPRFVELNNDISDDVASRIDLAQLHNRSADPNTADLALDRARRRALQQKGQKSYRPRV